MSYYDEWTRGIRDTVLGGWLLPGGGWLLPGDFGFPPDGSRHRKDALVRMALREIDERCVINEILGFRAIQGIMDGGPFRCHVDNSVWNLTGLKFIGTVVHDDDDDTPDLMGYHVYLRRVGGPHAESFAVAITLPIDQGGRPSVMVAAQK